MNESAKADLSADLNVSRGQYMNPGIVVIIAIIALVAGVAIGYGLLFYLCQARKSQAANQS